MQTPSRPRRRAAVRAFRPGMKLRVMRAISGLDAEPGTVIESTQVANPKALIGIGRLWPDHLDPADPPRRYAGFVAAPVKDSLPAGHEAEALVATPAQEAQALGLYTDKGIRSLKKLARNRGIKGLGNASKAETITKLEAWDKGQA